MGRSRKGKHHSDGKIGHKASIRRKNSSKHIQHRNRSQKQQIEFSLPQDGVVVNAYSGEWLNKDFDWVYSNEIMHMGAAVHNGGWVQLLDAKGRGLGCGIYTGRHSEQAMEHWTGTHKEEMLPQQNPRRGHPECQASSFQQEFLTLWAK